MQKIYSILLLVGMFIFPSTVIADNACSSITGWAVFNNTNTTYDHNDSLPGVSDHYYYFNVEMAGSITITTDNSQVKLLENLTSCPLPNTGTETSITITFTEATDFNVIASSLSANQKDYNLTAIFIPSPIGLFKTNFPPQVKAYEDTNVTYTLTAINNTDTNLSGVKITDTLPSEVNASTVKFIEPTGINCDINTTSRTISCTGDLEANNFVDIVINTTVYPTSTGNIINEALITAGTDEASASSTLLSVDATSPVDLDIQKYAEAETIPPGTDFIYAVFVTNHTQGKDAELVTVTDLFPDNNVTIVSYNRGSGWDCDIQKGTNKDFTCYFDRPMGHEITYFTVLAHTEEGNYTAEANNTVIVDADNPLVNNPDHNHTFTNIITISDVNLTGGGVIGGQYLKHGAVEVLDNGLAYGDNLGNNRDDIYLQTKVASTTGGTIETYIIDNDLENVAKYQEVTTIYGNNKLVPLTVILKLGTDDCYLLDDPHLTHTPDRKVVAIFEGDEYKKNAADSLDLDSGAFDLRNIGIKKARIIMQYIDINAKLAEGNETCKVSSIDGNIKGLPQCLTNAAGSNKFDNNKYINTFGIEAFVRCAIKNGQPCNSSHGGYGDDPYDSEYGCYECTLGGSGSCSKDNFAIRPDAFYVDISDGAIYKAGKDYNLSFKGLSALDEETLEYNELENTSFKVDVNISDSTKVCQNPNIDMTPDVNFTDGIDPSDKLFHDVGDVNMTIYEINGSEFAKVDIGDTNDSERFITEFIVPFRIIPHHFNIEANLIDHNKINNFTYLHDINQYDGDDNYSMSAELNISIKAEGADNNITYNYTEECYAKDTNLTLVLNDTNITYPGAVPLTQFLYYNPVEDDNTTDSGEGNEPIYPISGTKIIPLTSLPIKNITSSFPTQTTPDENGTTHIEYKLNFDRKVHLAVNPFKIELSDVNITDEDDVEGSAIATAGTPLLDQNATMYYARTIASKFFYDNTKESSRTTPILIYVYCDLGDIQCNSLGLSQTNEVNWWLSLGHNRDNNDGNITLKEGITLEGNSDNWSVTPDVNITLDAIDGTITVSRGTTNLILPLKVEIDLDTTDTNHWLIYNKDTDDILQAPPSPLYKVRFIGLPADWAGQGDTGHVVESNASRKRTRRLGW